MKVERRAGPVPFHTVTIEDPFWAPRREINRTVSLEEQYRHCRESGSLEAFLWQPGMPDHSDRFRDSDVAKWLEAAAYSLRTHPDPELERRIDDYVATFKVGQCPDGYLNSYYGLVKPELRWANLRDHHEMYRMGHLIEAAVAYYEATGKRAFLEAVGRTVDCIDRTFGPEEGKRRGYCGHPEIELALVRLYRVTRDPKHLKLVRYLIDERGRQPHYYDQEAVARGERGPSYMGNYDYAQAHKPLREQTTAVGHAVRAMYIYAGMADVAVETGDESLLITCRALWRNVVQRKMFITGGVGHRWANEGFTFDYDLPTDTAYSETCAALGLMFWAQRMFALEPRGEYVDVLERALYNTVAASTSLDGHSYFYCNPLAAHPGVGLHGEPRTLSWHHRREPWFGVACCPPNIARVLASLGQYAYAVGEGILWVNLYLAGQVTVAVTGAEVVLRQVSRYPWDGRIRLEVDGVNGVAFALALRVPGWARGFTVTVNGRRQRAAAHDGYVTLRRRWTTGDRVELVLPMPVEAVAAHPAARQLGGRVALQRGPLVYCLEQVDNGPHLTDLRVDVKSLKIKWAPRICGGVMTLVGRGSRRDPAAWKDVLYAGGVGAKRKRVPITAVPYGVWANREAGEMVIWMQGEDAKGRSLS